MSKLGVGTVMVFDGTSQHKSVASTEKKAIFIRRGMSDFKIREEFFCFAFLSRLNQRDRHVP